MTQIYYRANLNDAEFPFISTFQGKTVIQPSIDQNYVQSMFDKSSGDRGIPEAYYMHNVLPSVHGYKSVGYTNIIPNIAGVTFTNVYACKDYSGNRGLIAITNDGRTFLASSYSPIWDEVTPPGQPVVTDPKTSVANATGTSFICYPLFGIFVIDLANKALTLAAIQWDAGMASNLVVAISASNNYLLAHDGVKLYWSSALDVLDFKASQITGAGNGTPTAAVGNLIAIAPVGVGFAVYCQGNIVVATFSGNVQYPWLFKEAPNGSGIESVNSISAAGDEASNYAWTSAGLLKVTLGGCQPMFPEATDFLSGNIFEDYNSITGVMTTEYTDTNLEVRLSFVSSRLLVISYGKSIPYTHALIYDIALKRWGKLKFTHIQALDITFKLVTNNTPSYIDLGFRDYISMYSVPYNAMNGQEPIAPDSKESFVLVAADGSTSIINTEFGANASDAVLLLGKYQIFRANTVAIQGFTIESIDSDNTNFSVKVLTSIDGKNPSLVSTPYETVDVGIRQYDCLAIGQNHSLLIKGAFHVTALVAVFSKNGNR